MTFHTRRPLSDQTVTRRTPPGRCGATLVETAIVLTVLVLLVFGLIVGGFGVFRTQQTAFLACEGARWASTRGAEYAASTNQNSPTTQQITDQAILPIAIGMGAEVLTVQVQWIDQGTGTAWNWDAAPKTVWSVAPTGEYVTNTVRVTVTYQWTPGAFWAQTALADVCELPMSN